MLVYLHGFNSSPASHKALVMKAHMEGRGQGPLYACPALPDTPQEAIRAIETQKNLYTGAPYELTRAHLEGWRALLVDRIDPERYLLLIETGDEVLDWREAVRKYEGARMVIRQGGDHSLQSFPEQIGRILAFAGIPARA